MQQRLEIAKFVTAADFRWKLWEQFYTYTSRGTRLRPVHFEHPILSPLQSANPLQSQFLGPLTLGVGLPEKNASYNLPGVDVVLHTKFQLCRSNGVAAFREHTHSHLYYIDLIPVGCFDDMKISKLGITNDLELFKSKQAVPHGKFEISRTFSILISEQEGF